MRDFSIVIIEFILYFFICHAFFYDCCADFENYYAFSAHVNFTDHRTYASVLRLNFKILRSIFAGLCFTPFFFEIYRFSWYYILQERCPFPASSGHTGTVLPLSKPLRPAVRVCPGSLCGAAPPDAQADPGQTTCGGKYEQHGILYRHYYHHCFCHVRHDNVGLQQQFPA
jgi:hypothetical protein